MKVTEWLALAWSICWVIFAMVSFVSWQPLIGSIILVLLLWFVWIFYREWGRKERELSKQGFHVEWLSQGQVRAGLDDIAVVYHDPRGEICFEGKLVGRNSVIHIPGSRAWELKVPDWAKEQRHVIVERIRESDKRIIVSDELCS